MHNLKEQVVEPVFRDKDIEHKGGRLSTTELHRITASCKFLLGMTWSNLGERERDSISLTGF